MYLFIIIAIFIITMIIKIIIIIIITNSLSIHYHLQRIEAELLLLSLLREKGINPASSGLAPTPSASVIGAAEWGHQSHLTRSHYLSLLHSLKLSPENEELRQQIESQLRQVREKVERVQYSIRRPVIHTEEDLDSDVRLTEVCYVIVIVIVIVIAKVIVISLKN